MIYKLYINLFTFLFIINCSLEAVFFDTPFFKCFYSITEEGSLEVLKTPKPFVLEDYKITEASLLQVESRIKAAEKFLVISKEEASAAVCFYAEDEYFAAMADYFNHLDYCFLSVNFASKLLKMSSRKKAITVFDFSLDQGLNQLFFWAYLEQLKFLEEILVQTTQALNTSRESKLLLRKKKQILVVKKAMLQLLEVCFFWLTRQSRGLSEIASIHLLNEIKKYYFSEILAGSDFLDTFVFCGFLRFHLSATEKLLDVNRSLIGSLETFSYWVNKNFYNFLPGMARVIMYNLKSKDPVGMQLNNSDQDDFFDSDSSLFTD